MNDINAYNVEDQLPYELSRIHSGLKYTSQTM